MRKMGLKAKWKTALAALAAAGALTLLAGLGVLTGPDRTVSDAFYQRPQAFDGNIVLVGIDPKALEELGPYAEWGRDVIAMAVDALNKSEDCRPAVIALDILFSGETDPGKDLRLAEAAGRYGNVIAACAAEFGGVMAEDENGEFYWDDFAMRAYEEPYGALRGAAVLGHINTMMDTDGILRHHLLQIMLPDGTAVPSMALAAAQMYRGYKGQDAVELPPTDSRGFWYLPFSGRPGDLYENISVAGLLSGAIPAEYFADKIVFIGPYAAGLQDSYVTAADHTRLMYGVEYQANAVQALLRGEYKREVRDAGQLVFLFFLLLAAFIGFWRRRMWTATVLWLVLSGGWLPACHAAYERGWVLHVLWVPVGVTVLYIGCIAANYIRAALEKRQITGTFKRYVAPEIVNEILREGTGALELGGKQVQIAVLFVDVRGFTPMSERLEPAQVVEVLNDYLTLISRCILDNGGTLDKFIGDAAMAFWGAPLPQEDFVMKAVRAAADMVEGSRALSQHLEKKYGQSVSFGIGIHVGEAVVGNIGSRSRMDYTAIGDTVNTSARLEANAPAGTIYISRAVADALEGRIRVTSLGDSIRLKGKQEGFEVLTMDGIL